MATSPPADSAPAPTVSLTLTHGAPQSHPYAISAMSNRHTPPVRAEVRRACAASIAPPSRQRLPMGHGRVGPLTHLPLTPSL